MNTGMKNYNNNVIRTQPIIAIQHARKSWAIYTRFKTIFIVNLNVLILLYFWTSSPQAELILIIHRLQGDINCYKILFAVCWLLLGQGFIQNMLVFKLKNVGTFPQTISINKSYKS